MSSSIAQIFSGSQQDNKATSPIGGKVQLVDPMEDAKRVLAESRQLLAKDAAKHEFSRNISKSMENKAPVLDVAKSKAKPDLMDRYLAEREKIMANPYEAQGIGISKKMGDTIGNIVNRLL